MADPYHSWQVGSPPPIIRPHSLTKHRVLEQYLLRYVEVLTANPLMPQLRITLIDGFSGGGLYHHCLTNEIHQGSPLLMLGAMREAAVAAQARRSKDFHMDVEYFFIEKSPDAFAFLKSTLEQSDFAKLLSDKITLLNDEFVNCVARIVNHIHHRRGGRRAIFLLDQCGYSEVPLTAIHNILSNLNNAEIILTFAVDSLIDYLGANNSMQATLSRLGLELTTEQMMTAKQHASWRLGIQTLLHRQLVEKSTARYFTPFFIRSVDAHRDLWLIHLSNHSRARDVMTSLHWQENKSFAHYGGPGLSMLGYDQTFDESIAGQAFLFDGHALDRTKESLMEQLPARLEKAGGWITFEKFFAGLTNETPATSAIVKVVLAQLLKEGEIEIRGKTGSVRQSGVQQGQDVIKRSDQRTLYIP